MAATVPEYVVPLILNQQQAAQILGTDVMHADFQSYRINLTILAYLGMILKALHDKGVVLDAEWIDRLSHLTDGDWPDWLINQTAPPA